jgi:hypothetical protein
VQPRKNAIPKFKKMNIKPNTIDHVVPRRKSMKEDAKQHARLNTQAGPSNFSLPLFLINARIAAEGIKAKNNPTTLTQPRPFFSVGFSSIRNGV